MLKKYLNKLCTISSYRNFLAFSGRRSKMAAAAVFMMNCSTNFRRESTSFLISSRYEPKGRKGGGEGVGVVLKKVFYGEAPP